VETLGPVQWKLARHAEAFIEFLRLRRAASFNFDVVQAQTGPRCGGPDAPAQLCRERFAEIAQPCSTT
jgi:hypothetical protein